MVFAMATTTEPVKGLRTDNKMVVVRVIEREAR